MSHTPPSTTDVIACLLAHGWRWETHEKITALTNAPPGQQFCVGCGRWAPIPEMRPGSYCLPCYNESHRIYMITGTLPGLAASSGASTA